MDRERSRRPSEWNWLHYADPALAPMCRSVGGSNVPVTRWLHCAGHAWLHCADHQVAPMCRSVTSECPPRSAKVISARITSGWHWCPPENPESESTGPLFQRLPSTGESGNPL